MTIKAANIVPGDVIVIFQGEFLVLDVQPSTAGKERVRFDLRFLDASVQTKVTFLDVGLDANVLTTE